MSDSYNINVTKVYDDEYAANLCISNQMFTIQPTFDGEHAKDEAEWMAKQLHRALEKIVTETREECVRLLRSMMQELNDDKVSLGCKIAFGEAVVDAIRELGKGVDNEQ